MPDGEKSGPRLGQKIHEQDQIGVVSNQFVSALIPAPLLSVVMRTEKAVIVGT